MRFLSRILDKHQPRYLRVMFGCSWGLIGLMAFCTAQIILMQQTPLNQPALLVGASAIALHNTNGQEQLYVFSQMLGRIQVFDTNGTFQTSIATPSIKGKLTLCGGVDHPILLTTSRRHFYELKQGAFIEMEDQPLPRFCQTSKQQTTAVGQYSYRLKDWPTRITYRPISQNHENILISDDWWIAISSSFPLILGFGLVGGGLQILGYMIVYSRNPQGEH